jgi:hypothetical protein
VALTEMQLLPQHMGSLHPIESVLVAVLAFGPFVALGIVVYLQRRRDDNEDES